MLRSASLDIAKVGIRTSGDYKDLMSALMTDLVSGSVTPQVGNAVCNAAGKLAQMVKLEMIFSRSQARGRRTLELTSGA